MSILDELLTSKSYAENMKAIQAKIEELTPLVKAKGGLDNISKLETEAKSKTELAKRLLDNVRNEAEVLISKAKSDAEEIINTAKEKAAKVQYLADQNLKSATTKEQDIKSIKVSLNKSVKSFETEKKAFDKKIESLAEREADIQRKESILAQLKA